MAIQIFSSIPCQKSTAKQFLDIREGIVEARENIKDTLIHATFDRVLPTNWKEPSHLIF